jgi:type III pantothenate kinase
VKLLAIDRGNSRTKIGLQQNDGALEVHFFYNDEESPMLLWIEQQQPDAAVMSSVAATGLEKITAWLQQHARFLWVTSTTPIPIKNNYATPETLGMDRLAGAIGAWAQAGKKDVLLLDAGTCINYECVVNHTYIGGAIAPGLTMRLKAMHHFTGKLPLVELPAEQAVLTGNSTATCMLSGAIWGMVHEMEGIAGVYQALYPGITLILGGGDAPFLGHYLKNSIFAPHKEVVLIGLLEILKYNLNVEN